ncbi:E3 ubiquitin-protein ligase TRIM71-like [Lineus longissimus]|uniref:E3 ubiquitin-protein ligase TRIM71-like n=1 Tax=Lineus longissimus TaxID=88925 RepID=UPI00315D080E
MVMSILTIFRQRDFDRPWVPDEIDETDDKTKMAATQDSPRKYEQLATPRRTIDPGRPRKFMEVEADSPRKFRKVGAEAETPRKYVENMANPTSPRKFCDLATPRRASDPGTPRLFLEFGSPRKETEDLKDTEELGSPRKESYTPRTESSSPRKDYAGRTPRYVGSPRKAQTPHDPWRPKFANTLSEISTPQVPQTPLNIIPEENPNCELICKFKATTGRDEREAWIGGVTVLKNSHIALTDMANKTVKTFDLFGNMRKEFWGKGTFKFGAIRGIARTSDNNILVADTERELFYEFSTTGEPIKMKKTNGCWRVAMTSAGNTLAIDHKKRCIFMFNIHGTLMRILATANEEGKCVFLSPQSVAVGKDDTIIVADDRLNAVQIFDNVGDHIKTYAGHKGRGKDFLNGPKSVCTDEEGNIYVADTANDMIQVLTPSGEFKETLLSRGDKIHLPWAIAYHKKKLVVAEQFGQVKVFKIET